MKKIETTLLLIIKDGKIMLAKKKRGFGEGKYNGVGGKIESGETTYAAAIRECQEEIGVTPLNIIKYGEIEFIETYKGERQNLVFHLYLTDSYEGELKDSDEMEPHWFNLSEVPYDEMFPDDTYWLPYILDGKKIKAFFEFDDNWNLLSKNIEEVPSFD